MVSFIYFNIFMQLLINDIVLRQIYMKGVKYFKWEKECRYKVKLGNNGQIIGERNYFLNFICVVNNDLFLALYREIMGGKLCCGGGVVRFCRLQLEFRGLCVFSLEILVVFYNN